MWVALIAGVYMMVHLLGVVDDLAIMDGARANLGCGSGD